jgi:hypothetical protein
MGGCEFRCDRTDERITLSRPSSDWTIRFNRAGDRWTHALWFGSSDHEPTEIVSAMESQADRDDPGRIVSPVYQELHRHEPAYNQTDGICLLLTGNFFQHHFSAVISLFRDPDSRHHAILDFDVADRCRRPVLSLAATYLVRRGSSDLAEADHHGIAWNPSTIVPGRLAVECISAGTLALAEAGRLATRVQALATLDPALFTHRLRYRWRWEISS